MMGWDFGWGWIFFGGLMMVLFWGGLIALIVFALRGFSGGGQNRSGERSESQGTSNPLEILKIRYAKGEITRDEFETIRKDLQA